MKTTLGLVRDFRAVDKETPIVLMGYANPIFAYGVEAFAKDAVAAGVDAGTLDAMHAAYTTSARLEWMFWDSAYRLGRWPV